MEITILDADEENVECKDCGKKFASKKKKPVCPDCGSDNVAPL